MACYVCGWPGESEAHHGDCWMAYLHPGRNRHEAKQLIERLYAERDTATAQAATLRAALAEVLANGYWANGRWVMQGAVVDQARALLAAAPPAEGA